MCQHSQTLSKWLIDVIMVQIPKNVKHCNKIQIVICLRTDFGDHPSKSDKIPPEVLDFFQNFLFFLPDFFGISLCFFGFLPEVFEFLSEYFFILTGFFYFFLNFFVFLGKFFSQFILDFFISSSIFLDFFQYFLDFFLLEVAKIISTSSS